MSHFTLQCHKFQLLLWQFAENTPSKSLFCVKYYTCDSWHFPDFNGLFRRSTQCGLCLHFTYLFVYSFNRYLLSIYCVPGSVPTWSLCLTIFVGECCSMCCKHRQEMVKGCSGNTKELTWGKQPPTRDQLWRHLWPFQWKAQQTPSPVSPLWSTSHTPLLYSKNFHLRLEVQLMNRVLKEPPNGFLGNRL